MFLELLKKSIKAGRIAFVGRKKNLQFLAKVGWTVEDVYNFLYENIKETDFVGKSIDKDDTFPEGYMYIFKKKIFENKELFEVYIKIKYSNPNDYLIIISFHETER